MISVITPSFNRAGMISTAIESVLAQNYPNFEHIIVDGGSTDETLLILAKYPHLKIISQPDNGMYDAINKGLALASGEIIGFLNTDDLYANDIFAEVAEKFDDDQIMAVAGEAVIFSENPEGMSKIIGNFFPKTVSLLELSTTGSPFFNAWFFRKSVFEKIGIFESKYQINADRDFMLRLALNHLEYTTLNKLVYQYRQHPGSMTFDLNDEKLERILNEQLYMTEIYLHNADLSRLPRNLIRRSHTADTLNMAICSIRQHDLRKLLYYMAAGTRYDLFWGLKFGNRALGAFIRRLKCLALVI